MSVSTIVSICISATSLLVGGGAIIRLIDLGRFTGRMEQRLETIASRAEEDRRHDADKFDTLYNDRNEQDRWLVKVETQLESISTGMKEIRAIVDGINSKIDSLVQGART